MKRAFITGGTGFLGEHVARELVARGVSVSGIARAPSERLSALGVELSEGDVVRDLDGQAPLEEKMKGADVIFHLAGFVSRDPADGQRMMRVHVDGTRRLMAAAKAAGVKRIVLASTSGTIAVSREPDPILDETAPYPTELVSKWAYYLSKIYQEKVAQELSLATGVEVVYVNPSILFGPGDERMSSTGDVQRFLRRDIPVVPSGGINFVDARDAAAATVEAATRGRTGERYLLGGPNWTFAEFFGRLERTSKVRAPKLKLPDAWAKAGATLMEEAYRAVNRQAPVDRISVEMSQVYWYCDSQKAERELGFAARDPLETLDDTVRDVRKRML